MNNELQKERIRILRQRTDRLEHEGDFWTKDEIKMLVNGFHDCVGITEMADLLQRMEPAVMQQIEKMDLYHRKDNPKRTRRKSRLAAYAAAAGSAQPTAPTGRLPGKKRRKTDV